MNTTINGKIWHCPDCGDTELDEVHLLKEMHVPIRRAEKAVISLRNLAYSERREIERTVDGFYCPNCHLYLCENTRNENVEKLYERLSKDFPDSFS